MRVVEYGRASEIDGWEINIVMFYLNSEIHKTDPMSPEFLGLTSHEKSLIKDANLRSIQVQQFEIDRTFNYINRLSQQNIGLLTLAGLAPLFFLSKTPTLFEVQYFLVLVYPFLYVALFFYARAGEFKVFAIERYRTIDLTGKNLETEDFLFVEQLAAASNVTLKRTVPDFIKMHARFKKAELCLYLFLSDFLINSVVLNFKPDITDHNLIVMGLLLIVSLASIGSAVKEVFIGKVEIEFNDEHVTVIKFG